MNTRIRIALTIILTLCVQGFPTMAWSNEAPPLEAAFQHPPPEAKPWTFWYWMQNSATKAAITRDLEAMADHGIGGVYLFTIGGGKALTDPPVPSLSDVWWEHIDHTLKEADRLGLGVRLNACDGWATAGSPAITPELSMQEITSAKVAVADGKPFAGKLPQPPTKLDYYRDLAVLAYPEPMPQARTSLEAAPKVTTSQPGLDASSLVSGNTKGLTLPMPGWVQYEFATPFTCRAITVCPVAKSYQAMRLELQVSDDGFHFHSLGRLPVPRHGFQDGIFPITTAIPAATARFFRFVCDPAGSEPAAEDLDSAKDRSKNGSSLFQLVLSESPTLLDWQGKAGFLWRTSAPTTSTQVPDALAVPRGSIIDLSAQMAADGELHWTPPDNRTWTLLRIGYTSTGKKNGPAGAGIGLEPDKFNPAAVPVAFTSWYARAVEHQAKLGTKSLVGSHVDSWECRSQNWSPVMLDEFKRRRHYDPTPYLPAMTGVAVESAEISERFLCDVRQTISELLVDNFFTPMDKLIHERGGDFSAECVAPAMPCDGMAHFGRVDLPMGEFWYKSSSGDKPTDILDAINGARLYGKQIVQSEAFTYRNIDWADSPFEMKTMGDHEFALGINRFILHVWAHKATEGKPGINLWSYGSDYSDGQTWWKPGIAWFQYLTRCQAVLQRGIPVADVLYYVGEDQPTRALLPSRLDPALPPGYTYGCIGRDALLGVVKAEDGRIVLPGGMSYRALVLPKDERMSPEVARVIADLSGKGVPVMGEKPRRSLSLSGYPQCDAEVRRIVDEGWINVRPRGPLEAWLGELKLVPDLLFPGVDEAYVWRAEKEYASPPISWTHRREDDTDIYFLSNQEYQPRVAEAVFHVSGKQPELWDAATGQIRDLTDWSVKGGCTHIPLEFAPAESFFVIFRRSAAPPQSPSPNFPALQAVQSISGPWKVDFEAGRGAPPSIVLPVLSSLHTNPDEGVKHFSGTATYRCEFTGPKNAEGQRLFLNFGRVANLAEVTINGKPAGIIWKPPYRVEVTGLLAGKNTLEVAVSNTWRNRMLADSLLPENQRIAQAPLYKWDILKDKPLVESGLLGPVTLERY